MEDGQKTCLSLFQLIWQAMLPSVHLSLLLSLTMTKISIIAHYLFSYDNYQCLFCFIPSNKMEFRSMGYLCQPSRGNYSSAPMYVTLIKGTICQETVHISLLVQDIPVVSPKYDFLVCIHGPLYRRLAHYHLLVEHVEASRIFGAEKVVMYEMDTDPVLRKYLDYYVETKYLHLYKWRPPLDYSHKGRKLRQAKTGAQVAMLNDCIYRYMYITKYMVMVNLDEFIVPRMHDHWHAMMNASACRDTPDANARNVFYPRKNKHLPEKYQKVPFLDMVTVTNTIRDNETMGCMQRAKSIVRPDMVLVGGVHTVSEAVVKKYCCLEETLGIIQHYNFGWPGPNTTVFVNDTFMYKYADKLAKAVESVHKAVNER